MIFPKVSLRVLREPAGSSLHGTFVLGATYWFYHVVEPPFSGISFRQFKKIILFCPRVTWAVERARGVFESFPWIETIRFMKGFLIFLVGSLAFKS